MQSKIETVRNLYISIKKIEIVVNCLSFVYKQIEKNQLSIDQDYKKLLKISVLSVSISIGQIGENLFEMK